MSKALQTEGCGGLSRRHLALYASGGAIALLAAGCSQQAVTDIEKQVANFINQVQQGVVTGCAAIGKLVPTANSVIAVLAGIAGSSNPAVVTAAMIAQAIGEITGQACAVVTPPTPHAAGAIVSTPASITVLDGKVPVVFY